MEPEGVFDVAASMAREVVRAVERACNGSGETCLIIIRRALGMTYDEIGCLAGLSHIAVKKRIYRVVKRHPEMRGYLDPVVLDHSAREELERRGIFRPDGGHKRNALKSMKSKRREEL